MTLDDFRVTLAKDQDVLGIVCIKRNSDGEVEGQSWHDEGETLGFAEALREYADAIDGANMGVN